MPKRSRLTFLFAAAVLLAIPSIGNAQYMYTDVDGDGVHSASDVLNASGPTSLDIWLDTNHDRNGTLQSCNSHSGGPSSGAPLDLFSYTIVLQTAGGTVSWGTFTAADPAYTLIGTDLADDHDTEFNRSRPAGSVTPPGLVKLGTITLTVTSGAPSVRFGLSTPIDPFGFGTGFGTDCDAYNFPNTYVLASPGDPAGDWFDADGAGPPVSANNPPTLSAPATVGAHAGAPVSFSATANDPDASDVLTIIESGAPASLTFSSSPGPSPSSASLSGTPTVGDANGSPYNVAWSVSDGVGGNASATTVLTVARTDTSPVVAAPDTALFAETVDSDFGVGVTDAEGDPITSLTADPLPAGATFTPSAFNASGHFEWKPSLGQAGTYPVTFTATSGSPALSGSATTVIKVGRPDKRPIITAPKTATVNEGATLSVTMTASDPDGDPITAMSISGTQSTALPRGLTFTHSADFITGHILWTPDFTQAGVYSLDLECHSFGPLGDLSDSTTVIKITVRNVDRAPAVTPPASVSGAEGMPLTISISAVDPDGDAISSLTAAPLPMGATFAAGMGNVSGTLAWTPDFSQAGAYDVTFTASNLLSGVATTHITISHSNRPPVARPGGPYTGIAGVALTLDGRGSSDPDGNSLQFDWDFESDGIYDATGATPSHRFAAVGTYNVKLRVTDNALPNPGVPALRDSATTTATIQAFFPARVFRIKAKKIQLSSDQHYCFQIEPVAGNFALADVAPATLVMKYGPSQASAEAGRTALIADTDHNGIPELQACFSAVALRTLFASAPNGKSTVTVALEGDLAAGGKFRGEIAFEINKGDGSQNASVSPNPLNPQGTLSFTTSRPGSARVEMFDIRGRLVRTVLPQGFMPAGYHEVTIDGFGQTGEKLASGVYFYNVNTVDGSTTGRLTILK